MSYAFIRQKIEITLNGKMGLTMTVMPVRLPVL